MEQIKFEIHELPLSTLTAVLEAVSLCPQGHIPKISLYAGYDETKTGHAVEVLESLKLVVQDEGGKYSCTNNQVKRGDEQAIRLVLRRALQRYRPFEAYCEGLAHGENHYIAARKTSALLDLDSNWPVNFQYLAGWGRDLGILKLINPWDSYSYTLTTEASLNNAIPYDNIITIEDVESEAKARLYISGKLGRMAYNYLKEDERSLLVEALLSYQNNPSNSVEKVGHAIENFLREIANDKGFALNAQAMSGAGQLGEFLASRGTIHSNHQKLVAAISAARNAIAHHKDKKTMSPWEIEPFAAFWALSTALVTIRSIYEYVESKTQTL